MLVDVKTLRKRLGGLTQAEMAKKLGVSQSTVCELESDPAPDQDGPLGILLRHYDAITPPLPDIEVDPLRKQAAAG